MKLHLNKELFKEFIDNLKTRTGIDSDIIEKDYYVCTILRNLSEKQDELQAYFKGGTAIYKILDTMNRFSEDIDLTVKVILEQSNTKNKNRLKQSALGYKIEGLELLKDDCIDNKGSVTGIYKYDSIYNMNEKELHRAGIIQVEATSFTVSEPYQKYTIEPLVYKLANENERRILEDQFDVSKFDINIINVERMFIDKIFATEFYYIRNMYTDTSKHLYDISVLFENENIKNLLNNTRELNKLIQYKRKEENVRIGGINADTKIKDFNYFKLDFSKELIQEFNNMQYKYVLDDKYKITIDEVKKRLLEIYNYLKNV
ncbi:MAG: nucleotidyl transferase AbiEii/AbiGii toxin family protein [Clostridia bacterium]|nr:nucleotidyl transferase AbiEii/AbiGii toxin family protein [Clostridia bacterium]